QAEDGIRDRNVTGVQTCALPIYIEWSYYKKNISSSRISIFSKTPIDFFQLPNLPRINYKTNPSLQTIIEKWWKNNFNTPSNIIMQADNSETCRSEERRVGKE